MTDRLVLGVPSKGRLLDDTLDVFRLAGLPIEKRGDERGYRGGITTLPTVDVEFLSAGEIARHLQQGRIHLGVTGEDLIREQIPDADDKVELLMPLGFGHADVVVAVPACWLDVETVADFEEAGAQFVVGQGRRLRVATKYPRLAAQFFAVHGVVSFRTVESLGATEGAPAAGMAEAIVDITSTGSTLKANGLRVLANGLILRSQAHLIATKSSPVIDCITDAKFSIEGALRAKSRSRR